MGTNIFELNDNGDFQIVGYIKSDEEVNAETEKAIASKYSSADEIKLLRLNDRASTEFIAYNTFVEKCRAEGRAEKQANADELAMLKQVEIGEGTMKHFIYTK
jgi:hypothetical protein